MQSKWLKSMLLESLNLPTLLPPSSVFYTNPLLCDCSKVGNNLYILCKMLQILAGRLDCYYTVYAISIETEIFYPTNFFNLN